MPSVQNQVVLVTGATGFIGRALCRALATGGAQVHALSRGGQAPTGVVAAHRGDTTQLAQVTEVMRRVRPDLVYDLAAHVTGSRDVEAVLPTLYGKLVSSVNVLTAAHQQGGCRVVLAGSLEEPMPGEEPVPNSPYAAATWATTAYGDMFHALYDASVVTARIFMAYGPGDPNENRLVPYVIRSLLAGVAPKLSSGERPVDWIYIDDLVAGLIELGADDRVRGGSVDLGSGELTTVREVALTIQRLTGTAVGPAFGALPDRKGETVRAADLEATRGRLDWSRDVPLEEGLELTISHYR